MKNLLQKKRAEGFTIIEVMIVLAIAGLIMVIVFIAVPQLQRNQRDNARQNIANRVKAELETYAGNNQGQYPFTPTGNSTGDWPDFVGRYISGGRVNVNDPSSGQPVVAASGSNVGVPQQEGTAPCTDSQANIQAGNFRVCYGARCAGENITPSGARSVNTRNYAVIIGLDRAGTNYCVDNG